MPKYVIIFEDNEDFAHKRHELMKNHLEFLTENASYILSAGPMFNNLGSGVGGMWIVRANSYDKVNSLVEEDPFFSSGIRKSIKILRWNLVFDDGNVL